MSATRIVGLMAEFETPAALLESARRAREGGYRRLEAYSPFPVPGLSEAVGFHKTGLPLLVLIGGIIGGLTGFFLQYYATVISYPLNVGGRPLNSWPSYVVIAFELTVLFAAGTAVLGMIALNGLPALHHPVFNVRRFAMASQSAFFLAIESADPLFDAEKTRRFLEELNPLGIHEIEP